MNTLKIQGGFVSLVAIIITLILAAGITTAVAVTTKNNSSKISKETQKNNLIKETEIDNIEESIKDTAVIKTEERAIPTKTTSTTSSTATTSGGSYMTYANDPNNPDWKNSYYTKEGLVRSLASNYSGGNGPYSFVIPEEKRLQMFADWQAEKFPKEFIINTEIAK